MSHCINYKQCRQKFVCSTCKLCKRYIKDICKCILHEVTILSPSAIICAGDIGIYTNLTDKEKAVQVKYLLASNKRHIMLMRLTSRIRVQMELVMLQQVESINIIYNFTHDTDYQSQGNQ